jgi:hypothetical protein
MTEIQVLPQSWDESASMSVRDAGQILAGQLWVGAGEEVPGHIIEAFRVANAFRDSHAHPMTSLRATVRACMRGMGMAGLMGARLKRMPAIRRKLKRLELTLDEMQDLAGCRVILPTMDDVRLLVARMRALNRHAIWDESDYIAKPKRGGYRSHHLMFAYKDRAGRTEYDGRRIELQIRTELQHAWATTVEAVGLLRGENLKGGQGNAEWLRLFQLMSAEFARSEGCKERRDVPAGLQRVEAIMALASQLDAVQVLNNFAGAVRWIEENIHSEDRPTYYLIRYDLVAREVRVSEHFFPNEATASYFEAEQVERHGACGRYDIVLVYADKIQALRDAYPNYFGDVRTFASHLADIVGGRRLSDFAVPKQESRGVQKEAPIDPGWLRDAKIGRRRRRKR